MKNKLLSILLSVFIAFGMWIYVVTVVDYASEATYHNIPVVLEGESVLQERGLMITSGQNNFATLKVSGKRSDLIKLKNSDITLKADLSKIYDPGEVQIVYTPSFPGEFASNAFIVESKQPDHFTVTVEKRRKAEVPVKVVCTGAVPEGYISDTEEVVLDCPTIQISGPESVVMAIKTLVKPGAKVVVTGFEHNAVVRPLYALGAEVTVAGRKLFDWENTLEEFDRALQKDADAAVFTHVSNVFGYILPVEEMASMCTERGVPFIIDAAQSAGSIPVSLRKLGADFIAMPGHKGLLGPQGTGLLLCSELPKPLLYGGTGSMSQRRQMPDFLPDRAEAGTVNVPGIAGLWAGLRYLNRVGIENIGTREQKCCRECIARLRKMPVEVFAGPHQGGTVSIRAGMDCERMAELLGKRGIAVRAGLHCAPLAHESAGTLQTGTVRISFGHACNISQVRGVLQALSKVVPGDF